MTVLSVLCGCVATKYKLAKKDTPPVQLLGIAFPPAAPLQATLASLVTYGGPGSWKREALWDEYVVELVNHGDRPLTIDSATLLDSKGTPYAAGSDPWELEKQSKKLEQQYRDRGEAFLRAAGPGVVIVGVGAAAAAGSATGALFVAPAGRWGRHCRGSGPARVLPFCPRNQLPQQEGSDDGVRASAIGTATDACPG